MRGQVLKDLNLGPRIKYKSINKIKLYSNIFITHIIRMKKIKDRMTRLKLVNEYLIAA